jgi:hypothetical protein
MKTTAIRSTWRSALCPTAPSLQLAARWTVEDLGHGPGHPHPPARARLLNVLPIDAWRIFLLVTATRTGSILR